MQKSINSDNINVENTIDIYILVNDMKRRKRSGSGDKIFEQIGFDDIKLNVGDKLYKNGELYAEIAGESEELYFLHKSGSSCDLPSPYFKETIIEGILFGRLILERLSFQ